MADILGGAFAPEKVSGYLSTANTVAITFVVVLFAIVFLVVAMYVLRHNKRVYLFMEANTGLTLKVTKGRINQKKREFTTLKHRDIMYPYPDSRYIVPEGKGEALFGYVANKTCTWLSVEKSRNFVTADMNMMNFVVDMYARIDEATKVKQSFWDKHLSQIIWGTTIMIFMVCIIIIMQSVNKAIAMGDSVGRAAAEAKARQGTQPLILIPFAFLFRKRKQEREYYFQKEYGMRLFYRELPQGASEG